MLGITSTDRNCVHRESQNFQVQILIMIVGYVQLVYVASYFLWFEDLFLLKSSLAAKLESYKPVKLMLTQLVDLTCKLVGFITKYKI